MSPVREMMAPIYKHLFVLTYSHSCFNVGLPPSFSLTVQQYPVCYWSNIMIKGAVCRTKNRPAIQLCYPAVHCSRQVVSFFPPGRLGQVHRKQKIKPKTGLLNKNLQFSSVICDYFPTFSFSHTLCAPF